MFLRSLTLRGFKSFADATHIAVEPGITVVVGPNGSGKSNIVDALSWVLGTHSARKVRGTAMTDVIFDGSSGRARASRARVEIAIDNTEGRLAGGLGTSGSAGGFTEVRVARTIQSDGETTYEINGEEVRAVDVQELLSDTGLGRELHTIVGQGQLDEILNAKPEERRRYIEEAAGILKHRRRRERAVRKLEAVDEHIEKLRTVLRELRRQLKPLERQAQAADRHAALQAQLREVRVQLAALEVDRLTREVEEAGRAGEASVGSVREVEERLERLRAAERELETELEGLAAAVEGASATYYGLTSLGDRLRGAADLVDATRRHLTEAVEEAIAGRPPEELRAQADAIEARVTERRSALAAAETAATTATTARAEAEAARRQHDEALAERRRQRAQASERRVRWDGEVTALRALVATRASELERAEARVTELDQRREDLAGSIAAAQDEIQQLDASEVELSGVTEVAEARVLAARERRDELVREHRELESERAAQLARAEALRAALEGEGGGAAALLDAGLEGMLGPVAVHVEVDGRFEAALAAALGPMGAAVVVTSPDQARRAIAWLRDARAGSALVLAVRAEGRRRALDDETYDRLTAAGARSVAELVRPAPGSTVGAEVVAALGRALTNSYLVRDWDTAVLLHGRDPDLTFVTPEGDVASPTGYRAGAVGGDTMVVTRTGAEQAEERAEALAGELEAMAAEVAEADATLSRLERELDEATDRLNESDARITGAADRMARLTREHESLDDQRAVLTAQVEEARSAHLREQERLVALEAAAPDADGQAGDDGDEPDLAALEVALHVAREAEFEARIARERASDEVTRLVMQAADLRREADDVERDLAEAERRRVARRAGIVRCEALARLAELAQRVAADAVTEAAAERDRVGEGGAHLRTQLAAARERSLEVAGELERVREARHATDLHRAEVASRLDTLAARLRAELSLTVDEVRAEVTSIEGLDAAALTEREDVLVRRIGLLGRVNPLALEEFRALEERHRFLSDQLEDLRRSRRDLEEVITAVDERIRQVFKAAFNDVAREFEVTFSTVFPGGKGRLVLTGEEDLLTAGVDVEARPPGKRVKRLSLLSGGERSLTVLAFVFAIFRARPSPFYVLDEVDAALDDVNLQRLLRIVRSFRGNAQVIMVTHQKRSMEIADLLYGVTMGPDAVTKVVAERLRAGGTASLLDRRASDAPTEALLEPEQPAAV